MKKKEELNKKMVCVVGLGYAGLPLMETFVKYFRVIGFDINENRFYI
jgi:UDP-N-acetyl-D-galactosamine dehydrogenase